MLLLQKINNLEIDNIKLNKFNYKPYEKNKIFFNGIDVSLPESEITYNNTKNISFIAPYEFRKLCCLSGYYKYW